MPALAMAAALFFGAGCAAPEVDPSDVRVTLELVADGFDSPVFATTAPGVVNRIYVVEQDGVIRSVGSVPREDEVFLDIRDLVGSGGERGLLGLAFEPGFPENRRFFVHYTDKSGDTVLARYRALDVDRADTASAKVLLTQDQPYANHNGGMIAFGPDGHLYLGLGDGGSGGDPQGNGQKLTTVLGKILRLDVRGDAYACPASNPDLGAAARCEIWAFGVRNPWRFSFDAETGDLWIGDVGQNQWEEIDFQPRASRGGENYGWNAYEGRHTFRAADIGDHVEPVAEYPTGPGGTCSVTGGYVYRGSAIAGLGGQYVFGDYCSGDIWSLRRDGGAWERFELLDTSHQVSSFGEDVSREILVVDHGGRVLRLVGA